MQPEFFEIFGISVRGYGFMIMIGALLGYWYMGTACKKELGIEWDEIKSLAIIVILMAVVGGKILFYLEDLEYYMNPPSNMLKGFRTGFVFYGSLLAVVPAAAWFFRKKTAAQKH